MQLHSALQRTIQLFFFSGAYFGGLPVPSLQHSQHYCKHGNYYTADLLVPSPSGQVIRVELYTPRNRVEELRARSGRPVTIWAKPGFLGFAYVTDFEFQRECRNAGYLTLRIFSISSLIDG